MSRFVVFISLVICLLMQQSSKANASQPGAPGWDSGFDGQQALKHVYVLASDSLAGRYSSFTGWDKVERYLSSHFRRCKLKPPFGKDGYLHKFTYSAGEYRQPVALMFEYPDGRIDTAQMWEDFNIFKYSGYGKISGRLIWVGYGISAPDKGWDDYAGIDVTGAVVLAMRGTPDLKGVRWGLENLSGFKSSTAFSKGAVGFIYCDDNPPKWATLGNDFYRAELPAVWVSMTVADNLLKSSGKSKNEWKEEIKQSLKPVSRGLDVEVEIQVSGDYYPARPVTNIAGLLEGSDPVLKREVIVIGAHADHHGVDAVGNLYPGADDNASGTAAMMELADVFSKLKPRPKRSILFIGFAAEEEGLNGSEEFAQKLPLKGYDVVAMLNMDMVGQGSGEIGITGIGQSPMLGEELFATWHDSTLDKLEFWNIWPGSDHWPFAEVGIPAYVVGARGEHPNYHTPNDKPENIKPEVMKAVGDMMFACALALANRPEPIKPLVGRGQFWARSHPGAVFEIMHLEDFYSEEFAYLQVPLYQVKGVDYPQPLKVVLLQEPAIDNRRTYGKGLEYIRGLEILRESSRLQNNPFLADSCLKAHKGEPFQGITAAIPIEDLPADTLILKALARGGVGFASTRIWSGDWITNDTTYWFERAQDCRVAGLRLWLEFYDNSDINALLKALPLITPCWNGQIVCHLPQMKSAVDIDAVKWLLDTGCFIQTSDTTIVNGLINTKYFGQIGLDAEPKFIDALLESGVDKHTIEALLFDNLQGTLQMW